MRDLVAFVRSEFCMSLPLCSIPRDMSDFLNSAVLLLELGLIKTPML